jgi:hypothetical protein
MNVIWLSVVNKLPPKLLSASTGLLRKGQPHSSLLIYVQLQCSEQQLKN